MIFDLIGWVGVVFVTTCSIPQLIKIIKTGRSRDVSATTYALLVAGMFCYLIYAVHIEDAVFIVSNSIGLVANGTILALKIRAKGG